MGNADESKHHTNPGLNVANVQRPFVHASGLATLSDCGKYRYTLFRPITPLQEIDAGPAADLTKHLCWIMLNPSTADAENDDPTIRKVVGFTARAGYGGAWVVNLFAYRATDPRDVRRELGGPRFHAPDRVALVEGPDNRAAIESVVERCSAVVCAWGAQPWARGQAGRVLSWLRAMSDRGVYRPRLCLGLTKHGTSPLHPLMPSYADHPLTAFEAAS